MCRTQTLIWLIIFFLFSKKITAQTAPFGSVTESEIRSKYHSIDSTASAVYLFHVGKFYIENRVLQNAQSVFEQHYRIKIQKKDGYNYANVELPSIAGILKVSDIKASCYNWENGKIVESKLTQSDIITENIYKKIKIKKLIFNDVKEGSVIEISYKTSIEATLQLPDWQFQREIPTVWSEFNFKAPKIIDYDAFIQGVVPICKQDTKEFKQDEQSFVEYTFAMKDIPAFQAEPYMTSEQDNIAMMKFKPLSRGAVLIKQLFNSWIFPNLVEERNDKIITETQKAVQSVKDKKQRFLAIYNYFGKHYKAEDNATINPKRSFEEVIDSKQGSENALNQLFKKMLITAGIDVGNAYISTRKNGKINKEFDEYMKFDKLICFVELPDSSTYFIDAAHTSMPLGLLPIDDLNDEALIVFENKEPFWKKITNKIASKNYTVVNASISQEKGVKADVNAIYTAYDAFDYRKNLELTTQKKLASEILKGIEADGKIDSAYFTNPDSLQLPQLKAHFNFQANEYLSTTDTKIFIQPLLCFGIQENPFFGDKRVFDIDLLLEKENIVILNFTIPDGYKIEEMPKNSRLSLEDSGMNYNYGLDVNKNQIKVTSIFKRKRTIYNASEFEALKKFYAQVIEKMNEQIVLIPSKND